MGRIARGKIQPDDQLHLPASAKAPLRSPRALGLSVAIMAHYRRRKFVPYLLERLGDVEVIWDEKNDRWATGARSMAAYDASAAYHVVVQDDAILSTDFLAGVAEVLRYVPFGPVCFYTGQISPYPYTMQRAIHRARAEGAPYMRMRGPHWGVAVAVPTCLIADMLEACRTIAVDNYDLRMERFFTANELLCTYTLPSLVNHRVDGNPSMVPGRGSAFRRAYYFTDERSALDFDWTGEPFDVQRVDSNQGTRRFNEMAKKHRVYVRDARGHAVLASAQPAAPELTRDQLEKRTVREIRAVARIRKVDLSGVRRKNDMLDAIFA